ncbi:hypothetical protein LP419_17125 [Massilia sp. H-1]|nr:hypothetical protein LP419_17125 [Massilia sp. H-1]
MLEALERGDVMRTHEELFAFRAPGRCPARRAAGHRLQCAVRQCAAHHAQFFRAGLFQQGAARPVRCGRRACA